MPTLVTHGMAPERASPHRAPVHRHRLPRRSRPQSALASARPDDELTSASTPTRRKSRGANRRRIRSVATLYPVAVAGEIGESTLFIAREPACSSLLRPRAPWNLALPRLELRRDRANEDQDDDARSSRRGRWPRADAIKIDSQGMEVPILQAAGRLLPGLFAIEVETGLQANYHDETTFDRAAAFLLRRGFPPFDLYSIAGAGPARCPALAAAS